MPIAITHMCRNKRASMLAICVRTPAISARTNSFVASGSMSALVTASPMDLRMMSTSVFRLCIADAGGAELLDGGVGIERGRQHSDCLPSLQEKQSACQPATTGMEAGA